MSETRVRQVSIPRLLHVGSGCLREVAPLLQDHDFDLGRVLVGSGPGPSRVLAEHVASGLRAHGVPVLFLPNLTGSLTQAAEAASTIIQEAVTVAVAVGGGRTLDTLKLAAARTDIDFVSVPTAVSNDGISSPVASLVDRDGVRASHAARMPAGIVVDVAAIGGAPRPTIVAGVGDLVSNLTAGLDWRLADRRGHDRFDAYAAMIAEAAARPALDLEEIDSSAAHRVLAEGLLLSGLAMAASGTSRPCSGAEHLISHVLDAQLGAGAALHGEQVALGTLISAAAHESPLLDVLHRLYARLGLPVRPEDIGLTHDELVDAVLAAPAIRPDRWTILSRKRYGRRATVSELVERALVDVPATPLGRLAS